MTQAASLPEFVAPWQVAALTEKSAAQTHFIELCQALGKPWPAPGNSLSAVYAQSVELPQLHPVLNVHVVLCRR